MKRQVPIINLPYDIPDLFNILCSDKSYKDFVIKHTVEAIKFGLHHNRNRVDVCEIHDTGKIISLKREVWKEVLEKLVQLHVQNEEYDKCIEFNNLINQIK